MFKLLDVDIVKKYNRLLFSVENVKESFVNITALFANSCVILVLMKNHSFTVNNVIHAVLDCAINGFIVINVIGVFIINAITTVYQIKEFVLFVYYH